MTRDWSSYPLFASVVCGALNARVPLETRSDLKGITNAH